MPNVRKGTAPTTEDDVMRCRYCNVDLREGQHSSFCPTFEDARELTTEELEAAAAILLNAQFRKAREDGYY